MIGRNVRGYRVPTMVAHFEQRKVAEAIGVAAFVTLPSATKNCRLATACPSPDLITSSGRSASKGRVVIRKSAFR